MDRRALTRFARNRAAVAGAFLVLAIALFALLVPLASAHDPFTPDFEAGRGPFGTPGMPSRRHVLGTDTLFRDVLVRLAHGGRLSLEIALAATTISAAVGTTVGILAGWYQGHRVRIDRALDLVAVASTVVGASTGRPSVSAVGCFAGAALIRLAWGRGRAPSMLALDALALTAIGLSVAAGGPLEDPRRTAGLAAVFGLGFVVRVARERSTPRAPTVDVDDLAMRAVDVLLAFPFLLLVMALGAAIDRTTKGTIFLVLGLTAWTSTARLVRAKTLQIRELEFVTASRALGASTPRLLLRHVLPNVAGVVVVLSTNSVAGMIVAEAALSFLGLSIPPPIPSWGRMLEEGRPYYAAAPWLIVAPASAILVSVLGFNLLGEGLRDALDPRAKGGRA
jgi:ABC-type dipeptide/oligopeptide/nickel transport system permease subunit